MQWLLMYAFALVSRAHRYQWGGEEPIVGFDCSGFVLEILKASGEMPWNQTKLSAQEIYNHYEKTARGSWGPGALAFYGPDVRQINHVGFCVDCYSMIEAAGGDHTTVTDAVATSQHAFIKMRPIKYRKDFQCVLKPAYTGIGMIP